MNKLKPDKQEAVIRALVEGASIRSVERMTGVHRDTVMRLGVSVGTTCRSILDELMRDLNCERIELDEVWCYVGKKQRWVRDDDDRSAVGDFWTWVSMDSSFMVGKRDTATAHAFVSDLASRLTNRVQLSSDGLRTYIEAIEASFGRNVDYAQIVKSYEAEPLGPGRYSPPKVTSVNKKPIAGRPDLRMASTSFVERQNLTMRMCMRRLTRLTNGFSKKAENLKAAVALHFAYYNLVRKHRTLHTTPAVAAGVVNREWTLGELVWLAN